MQVAERMSRLGTETAFEVLVKARALEAQGRDVVHLEIGEPDFDTPPHVIAAGKQALDEGYTHYGPSAGLPELREAIAADVGPQPRHRRPHVAGGGDARRQADHVLRHHGPGTGPATK